MRSMKRFASFTVITKMLGLVWLILLVNQITVVNAKFKGWIDPDTKKDDHFTKSLHKGIDYGLVMSDEFEKEGRLFGDGDDPMWCAIEKSDDDQTAQGKKSLQFYNPSMVQTKGGKLVITTDAGDTLWKAWNPYKKEYKIMKRHFRSGMVQGWNKFCFTGGILEIKMKMPGRPDVGGLWPAAWMLGNLGRATYESSTNKLWPWSYDVCDREKQKAQEISACDVTAHYDFNVGQGRGATEIDLLEVMPGFPDPLPIVTNGLHKPYNSMTLQVAPGIPARLRRPLPSTRPEWGFHWYNNITYGRNVSINPFFYGNYLGPTTKDEPAYRSPDEAYQCDAIGSLMQLNKSHWEEFSVFRLEWEPGDNGYIRWYVDGEFQYGIEGVGLAAATGARIPEEPSYVILNTAISTSWGFPETPWGCDVMDCKTADGKCGFWPGFCESLPADFEIEYVRVYQDKRNKKHTLGCNPPKFPTAKYIKAHTYKYLTPIQSQLQAEALLPVRRGGALCNRNQSESEACGGKGMGTCGIFSRCQCEEDWTGPNCKQPAYCNDFPDWEDGKEWIGLVTLPHPSAFLLSFFVFMTCIVSIAVCYISENDRLRGHDLENGSSSGGGSSGGSGRSFFSRLWGKIKIMTTHMGGNTSRGGYEVIGNPISRQGGYMGSSEDNSGDREQGISMASYRQHKAPGRL